MIVHSMNDCIEDRKFNYVIVLSSVLFGHGTFICINKIDIIL